MGGCEQKRPRNAHPARTTVALLVGAVVATACSPRFPSPHGPAHSVYGLRDAVCSDGVEDDQTWVVGPVIVTAPRSRDAQEVEGRFAVQDRSGGVETGLWVEAPEGVPVEELGLRVGQELYLQVRARAGYPGCRSIETRLLHDGLSGTGRWGAPVATWEDVDASFWNRAGELVELQGELKTAQCPSCWGAVQIVTEYDAMEIRGSMVQIPSRKGMVLRNTVGIAGTMRTGMTPESFGLSLHPRGQDDLQIVEEGEDCTATLAEAVEENHEMLRITDGTWREVENEYASLDAGEISVVVYDTSGNWYIGCDLPEESGPVDITGNAGDDYLYVNYGPAWCNDDNRPTITDGLVE